jgi:putative DNA primase/helicase
MTDRGQRIQISSVFAHLPAYHSLCEGITDELADGYANYVDPELEPVHAAALSYAERGWDVFPAPPGKKKSHKSAKHSNGAKWGKTRDPEQIRKDFRRWPEANVGLPTGKANGFWVLEADTLKGHNVDGIASLRTLEKKHGALPKTLMAESPSGSRHHYFNWPEGFEIKNSTSGIALASM